MAGSWDERRERKARLLLRPALDAGVGGRWADIGCGDGVFTRLLLAWLTPESAVVAVDRNGGSLLRLQEQLAPGDQHRVQTVEADFTRPLTLPDPSLFDGILLANTLHFVRDKQAALANVISLLRPGGTVIIIEYNASRGNGAVPYPFNDGTCLDLMSAAGLRNAQIVNRESSSFLGEIYVARGVKRDA